MFCILYTLLFYILAALSKKTVANRSNERTSIKVYSDEIIAGLLMLMTFFISPLIILLDIYFSIGKTAFTIEESQL